MKLSVKSVKGCMIVIRFVATLIGSVTCGLVGAIVGWALSELASEIGDSYIEKLKDVKCKARNRRQNNHKYSRAGFAYPKKNDAIRKSFDNRKRRFVFNNY